MEKNEVYLTEEQIIDLLRKMKDLGMIETKTDDTGVVWYKVSSLGLLNPFMAKQREDKTPVKRFCKPTIEEVKTYCLERKNGIDAEQFWNFYESKGWKVGKTPMKDWQAAVRTWERGRFSYKNNLIKRATNALRPKNEEEKRVLEDKYKEFC